jgi:cobalt/nickel transport system permease protein
MHLAEGILPLPHAAAWAAVAAPFVGVALRRLQQVWLDGPSPERAILGMAGALTRALKSVGDRTEVSYFRFLWSEVWIPGTECIF